MFTILLFFVAIAVQSVAGDYRCLAKHGQCRFTWNGCDGGNFESNLCRGSWYRKCCVPSSSSSGSDYNCYGDVTRVDTSGASRETARQDRLAYSGIRASYSMVETDADDLDNYKSSFIRAGRENCIHPALIAAIASRESRAGRLLSNGYGDGGNAYGILQCDSGASGLDCEQYNWNSYGHINMMVKDLLVPFIKRVKRDHPRWTKEQQLKGGVAAYNFGPGNVQTISGMDRGTTGNDYSSDVIARAQYLISNRGW